MNAESYQDRWSQSVSAAERRQDVRMPAAHPVVVCDRRGRVLLRGRASNVSEAGVFCLTDAQRALRVRGEVLLEIHLPVPGRRSRRTPATRKVRYRGRVARTRKLGQLVGLGIELTEKLT
jgi:hypothetical protein